MKATFYTVGTVALAADTVAAAAKAQQYQTGAQWLVFLALAVGTMVAACAAGGAVWGVSSSAATAWWQRRRTPAYPPSLSLVHAGRHVRLENTQLLPVLDRATVARDERIVEDYKADVWAAAQAAADAADRPVRDGTTQPLPNPWRIDPAGATGHPQRGVDTQPWPWAAPVGGSR